MAVISYKCPSCGGPLKWDAARQKYSCEYCLSEFEEGQLAVMQEEERKTEEAQASSESCDKEGNAGQETDGISAYICPSCGAEIVTEDTTSATFCYYCHNPVVLQNRLSGSFRPDRVIPFAIDRERALEIFRDWIAKHKYVPSDFYSESQIEKFSGVYFPYWLYNGKVKGEVSGSGDRVRKWTSGDMQYTETKTYRIHRDGVMPVNNVSRIALNKASRVLCECVAPFEFEKMRPFSKGYLSGFMAEARDIERASVEPEVMNEVKSYAESCLRSEASSGYTNVRFTSVSAEITESRWEYVLMPVWTLTYKGRDGKIYYFSINGTSGKTVGELPVNTKKLWFLFAKIAVPVFIVLVLLFYFFF